ncbi:hatching enzyme 1.2-like [Platichthys flesus]|uniref:hatching enzyme 1.2-like n=1 Tax=Platichthys flesus TaxID=8260 RepID=UPI002DB8C181|nr:hatching enzyme 1.2-like [Platichthys flesus]
MWTLVVLFVLATAGCWAQIYENEEGGLLARFCPATEAVSHIKSTYVGSDRIWTIECKPFIPLNTDCSWSGFLSLNEKELNFNCKANQVITGVYSSYSPEHMDRAWNFRCCSADELITFECRESPKVNYYNEDFNWLVPGDNYLTGARTYRDSPQGDHRWSFNFCRAVVLDTQAVSSQILAANSPIANLLTQGDVAVQTTRNARVCSDCRWTKLSDQVQVPFIMSDSFSSSNKATIQNAINGLHTSTCVRFVPLNGQSDYVNIVKQDGCWSYVGQTGGAQQVSLGDGCLSDGIIQHELLHVLGFWHEQSRTDRDLYIQIHKDNIQDDRLQNFDKLDTYNLNVPYDYSSLMHYGPTDFSKNGLNTISAFSPTANIGQRLGLSEHDVLKVNKLYGCTDYLNKKGEWDNELGETLSRQCPPGQAVSSVTR